MITIEKFIICIQGWEVQLREHNFKLCLLLLKYWTSESRLLRETAKLLVKQILVGDKETNEDVLVLCLTDEFDKTQVTIANVMLKGRVSLI